MGEPGIVTEQRRRASVRRGGQQWPVPQRNSQGTPASISEEVAMGQWESRFGEGGGQKS